MRTLILTLAFVLVACNGKDSDTDVDTDTDTDTDTDSDTDSDTDTDTDTDSDTDTDTAATDWAAWGGVQVLDDHDYVDILDAIVVDDALYLAASGGDSEADRAPVVRRYDRQGTETGAAWLAPVGANYGMTTALLEASDGTVYAAVRSKNIPGSDEQFAQVFEVASGTDGLQLDGVANFTGGLGAYSMFQTLVELPDGDIVATGFSASRLNPVVRAGIFWRFDPATGLSIESNPFVGGDSRAYALGLALVGTRAYACGATTMDSEGGLDAYLVRRDLDDDTDTGTFVSMSTSVDDYCGPVATDGTNVYVAPSTTGVRYGATNDNRDPVLASYDAALTERWGIQFNDVGDGFFEDVTVGSDGHVYAVGSTGYNGVVSEAFVVSATVDGTVRWTATFGNGLNMVRPRAVFTADGDLFVVGWIRPRAGDGFLFEGETLASTNTTAGFVMRLDPQTGALR